jgi:tRNA threonylcarbamoyladenosine modification (KEOPS) complex  Pcc1 subunit
LPFFSSFENCGKRPYACRDKKKNIGGGKPVRNSTLTVILPLSKELARAVRSALVPETSAGKRCTLKVELLEEAQGLKIVFSSEDLSSLRASMNTNLRLVSSSLRTITAAEQTQRRQEKD